MTNKGTRVARGFVLAPAHPPACTVQAVSLGRTIKCTLFRGYLTSRYRPSAWSARGLLYASQQKRSQLRLDRSVAHVALLVACKAL